MSSDALYYLGFSAFSGIGPKRFALLLHTFGSAKSSWEAGEKDLETVLGKALSKKFVIFRAHFSLTAYQKALEEKAIQTVCLSDPTYPPFLKEITDAPFLLYVKGDKSLFLEKRALAVVGTRKVTEYGREVTEVFTRDLVSAGCVIVSGLALGVDGIAHETALNCGGKTIAVLGSSVDMCTPREHANLYEDSF